MESCIPCRGSCISASAEEVKPLVAEQIHCIIYNVEKLTTENEKFRREK
jgi:hypothetical protein